MKKFPRLIHVTVEGKGEDEYLSVNTDGVASIDENLKPVAIYQLVEVGKVGIAKRFIGKGER